MGRTITPKYVFIIDNGEPMIWDCASKGRPTDANLKRYILAYAKSLELGGVNAHISLSLGYVPYPRRAIIRGNSATGLTVAKWQAATFQVW